MIKDVKLAMMVGGSKAFDYMKKNPDVLLEEAMKHVVLSLDATEDAKVAGIAAANHVLKFKQKNPTATEKQAMQELANSANSILTSLDVEE